MRDSIVSIARLPSLMSNPTNIASPDLYPATPTNKIASS